MLSVLTSGGDPAALQRTYQSLAAQTDRRWQWCLAVGTTSDGHAVPGLPLDPRVVLVPGSAGDPTALLAFALDSAEGQHVMTLAAGDRLSVDMVETITRDLAQDGWGYTDEEQVFPSGRTPDLWEKPDFSPELLRSQPYAVRTAVLPRKRLQDAGGIRTRAGSGAWYDAVLRMSELVGPGLHLPGPLVVRIDVRQSQRFVEGDPADAARVVREHCARVGIAVDDVRPVFAQGRPVGQRVVRTLSRYPSVSIVVPTRGGSSVVRGRPRCHVVELARSLWVEGRYPDLEVVVVYDADTPSAVLEELREILGDALVLHRYEGWFHFSRKCNVGAIVARGEYLCFLNDDMEITSPDWLTEMVSRLEDPEVGAVGARLVFADGSLQHIGHRYAGGGAGHPLFGWRASTLALGAAAQVAGERSGVTAACLLLRSSDFARIGGFSELFPLNYNDVDLCLKIREEGMRIVYTPHAELVHFESQSRVPRILPSETKLLSQRWAGRLADDLYLRQSRPVAVRHAFLGRPDGTAGEAGDPATPAVPASADPQPR